MSVIDCPKCGSGYGEEGPRACCGVYTLSCDGADGPSAHEEVEWVEATGAIVTGTCVCRPADPDRVEIVRAAGLRVGNVVGVRTAGEPDEIVYGLVIEVEAVEDGIAVHVLSDGGSRLLLLAPQSACYRFADQDHLRRMRT